MNKTKQIWANWDTQITLQPNYIFSSNNNNIEYSSMVTNTSNNNTLIDPQTGNTAEDNNITSFKTFNQQCGGDIDLTDLNSLELVQIQNAGLKNLNITGLSSLNDILCQNNNLKVLNCIDASDLKHLYCSGNQLETLNMNHANKLETLECQNNNLSDLLFSNEAPIKQLLCGNNNLKTLNVSGLKKLVFLDCSFNSLETLIGLKDLDITIDDIDKKIQHSYLDLKNRRHININNNNFSKLTLNSILSELPNNEHNFYWVIRIKGNPGSDTCDKSIATNKGWSVE